MSEEQSETGTSYHMGIHWLKATADGDRDMLSPEHAAAILARIAELEADCKHWKAVAYEFGPTEADAAFLDG